MKKYFALVWVLLLCVLCTACAGTQSIPDSPSGNPDSSSTPAPQTTYEAPTFSQLLAERERGGGNGQQEIAILHLEDTDLIALPEDDAFTFPVYVDPYPTDQGGELYEVTDELFALQEKNLQQFLTCRYGEGEYVCRKDFSVTHLAMYEAEGISAMGRPYGISASAACNISPADANMETLAQDPLIAAGIDYLGLENPTVVYSTVEYQLDGAPCTYRYRIAEKCEDTTEQRFCNSFVYIDAMLSVEGTIVIQANSFDDLQSSQTVTLPDRDAIDTYLTERYGADAPTSYVTEVYYDKKISTGYFVPCYRIYLQEDTLTAQLGMPAYTTLELTSVESETD
ncbi:MAG: hypothetical protein ACI3VU_08365 [Faecousia sp.]